MHQSKGDKFEEDRDLKGNFMSSTRESTLISSRSKVTSRDK